MLFSHRLGRARPLWGFCFPLLDTAPSISSQQDDRVHGPRDGGCEPEDAGELATMATTAGDAVAECVAVMDFGELVSAM